MTAAGSSEETWLRGDWMQTFTGRQFYPTSPLPDDVDPADIAHALSLICRYGGHARRFYSVAEHCVLMSYAVPAEHALAALLHDATEAYVGDVVRPLKRQLDGYADIEARVAVAIARRFGLTGPGWAWMPPPVVEADNRILLDERAALFGHAPASWNIDHLEPLGVTLGCWAPEMAEWRYANRLTELLEARP